MESTDVEPKSKQQIVEEIGWLLGVTNPAQWLTDNYGKPRTQEDVAIRFSDRNDTYYFSREDLVERFEYFKKALCTDRGVPRWEEGVSNSCKPDVTSKDFGWVWRWVQLDVSIKDANTPCEEYFIDGFDVWKDCDAVKDALQAVVAADYLLLDNRYKVPFLSNMARLVALMVRRDRRNLTAADIEFVQTHRPFAANKSYEFLGPMVWEADSETSEGTFLGIFAIAVVRPFLQAGMTSDDYWLTQRQCNHERLNHPLQCECPDHTECPSLRLPQAGHENFEDWCAIIEHCKELMARNFAFSFAVMQAVSATLTTQLCGPYDTTAKLVDRQRYDDPLVEYLDSWLGCNTVENDKVDHCFVI